MSERVPRTLAVTIAGAIVFLGGALVCAAAVIFAVQIIAPRLSGGGAIFTAELAPLALFPLFLALAFIGLAMIRRWRHWRILSGVAAWSMIVIPVMGLFATTVGPPRPLELILRALVAAFGVVILVVIRGEKPPPKRLLKR